MRELRERLEEKLTEFVLPLGGGETVLGLNRQKVRDGGRPNHPSLVAWRVRVISKAMKTPLKDFNPNVINEEFITRVASLSYYSDGPLQAKTLLEDNGIHLVTERHLPGTFLDGAALRMPNESPIVALTLRPDRLDNFWFTLCHELAHVALHLYSGQGVEAIYDNLDKSSSELFEQEADSTASKGLIPEEAWRSAGLAQAPDEGMVCEFASRLKIHPSIPAGRIRFETGNYKVLSSLIGLGQVRDLFGS